MSPAISVLIVSWKVRALLAQCLASLPAATEGLAGGVEVIVVDNASGDGTVEMLRSAHPQVRLIANAENRGFATATNQAFAVAGAPVLVLLNPDTFAHTGSLTRLVQRLSGDAGAAPDTAPAVAGPRLLNTSGSLQRWTAGAFPSLANLAWHYFFLDKLRVPGAPRGLYLDTRDDRPHEVDWLTGACMALRRDCLDGRLFDEGFFLYGEDMALCRRLRRAGHRIVYAPESTVTHHLGRSLAQQSGELLVAPIHAARRFFAEDHDGAALLAFDLITGTGFALRAALYGLAGAVGRDAARLERARVCLRYARAALRHETAAA